MNAAHLPVHVSHATEALDAAHCDDDPRCQLIDLLADLRHWVDANADALREPYELPEEIDAEELWRAALAAALDHYAYETDPANFEELTHGLEVTA